MLKSIQSVRNNNSYRQNFGMALKADSYNSSSMIKRAIAEVGQEVYEHTQDMAQVKAMTMPYIDAITKAKENPVGVIVSGTRDSYVIKVDDAAPDTYTDKKDSKTFLDRIMIALKKAQIAGEVNHSLTDAIKLDFTP